MFYSFQGEALHAGKPSVWIRWFGCNLECNGFGQKDPTDPTTYVLPYKTFDISTVKTIEDLPVWHYGCDSSYSWSAKYKDLVHDKSAVQIVDDLVEMMKHPSNPDGLFVHPVTGQDTQLCFTGGEPMMWQKAMIAVLNELEARGNMPRLITIETNATQKIQKIFHDWMASNYRGVDIHFAMSPKLFTVSGEKEAVVPAIIQSYIQFGHSYILKFVCNGTEACWAEVDDALKKVQALTGEINHNVWIMPVGATKDQQEETQVADIAMEAMKRGYNVATRNHCYVFGNVIGK
jgi:6-pyruvoyltetrahydropterin 2'-reductase